MSCATLRPSRAPSRMAAEMKATASGWLSLSPRARRRSATRPAVKMSSLSFSRGVRSMFVCGRGGLRRPDAREHRRPPDERRPDDVPHGLQQRQRLSRAVAQGAHDERARRRAWRRPVRCPAARLARSPAAPSRRHQVSRPRGWPASVRSPRPQGAASSRPPPCSASRSSSSNSPSRRTSRRCASSAQGIGFAGGRATQAQHVPADERRPLLQDDVRRDAGMAAVERDGLLWQPFERGAIADREVESEGGGAAPVAIELRGGRRRQEGLTGVRDIDPDGELVATGDAARRVDDVRVAAPVGLGVERPLQDERTIVDPLEQARPAMACPERESQAGAPACSVVRDGSGPVVLCACRDHRGRR